MNIEIKYLYKNNGAPQGINYHDEENYTVYVSPYMTVTADRFTKHYFSNSQRIASKLGTGEFDNVYGVNNFHLTAGQKDYAERMVQIEESRQEYMKQNGIPPGVPTQKGQNIEPEITGVALPNKPLGNYDVPDGWPTPPHFNEKGDVPGPPLQWEEPEDISNPEAGYGYKTDNEEENDIFFFHSDHLGSTSYLTDKDGNACEFVCYMPYGEALVNENNTDFENLFKFSGMELDKETGLYNHGARQRDFWSTIWLGPDPLSEQFPMFTPYGYCAGNPLKLVDLNGKNWVKRDVDGVTEVYYDRQVLSQSDVENKYGKKSGVTCLPDDYSIEGYTFKNDKELNKYGLVYKDDICQDNSQIIYGENFTIFGTSDESCNAETLHQNLMGTSYTGPNNPQSYNQRDSYQYIPRNPSELGSYVHDKLYDDAGAVGVNGALFDCRNQVINADKLLVGYNIINTLNSNASLKDKCRSVVTVGVFNLIVTVKQGIRNVNNIKKCIYEKFH